MFPRVPLVRIHHITVYRTGFGMCIVLVLNFSILFSFLLILFMSYFIMALILLIGCLPPCIFFCTTDSRYLKLGNFRFAVAHQVYFQPWTFFQNIGLNMSQSESYMSKLYFQLGFSTGEFQALRMVVLAVFGVVHWPPASCIFVSILDYIAHKIMNVITHPCSNLSLFQWKPWQTKHRCIYITSNIDKSITLC